MDLLIIFCIIGCMFFIIGNTISWNTSRDFNFINKVTLLILVVMAINLTAWRVVAGLKEFEYTSQNYEIYSTTLEDGQRFQYALVDGTQFNVTEHFSSWFPDGWILERRVYNLVKCGIHFSSDRSEAYFVMNLSKVLTPDNKGKK